MSVTGQASVLSFAPQPAAYYDDAFNEAALDWHRVRTVRNAMTVIEDVQQMPLETGGPITPSGAFKQGVFYGGDADIIPRADGQFGWLLYAAMGDVTSEEVGVETGLFKHTFTFDPTGHTIPWIAFRREIPGYKNQAPVVYGETGYDCKIGQLSFTVPGRGQIACNVGVQGINFELEHDPTWTYEGDLGDIDAIPMAGYGEFGVGDEDFKVQAATIEFANDLTGPDQEGVVGKFRLDDITVLSRMATIRLVVKYENADLIAKILTGTDTGTEWTPQVFQTKTDGSLPGFNAVFNSPGIAADDEPFSLRIRAGCVSWEAGPLEVQGGTLLTQEFIGTVYEPDQGEEYLEIELQNAVEDYVWPTV
jgi:hypothetical protein